jgi:hypothetical protein
MKGSSLCTNKKHTATHQLKTHRNDAGRDIKNRGNSFKCSLLHGLPMRVCIDAARQDEFPSRIDDANAFRHRQILADLRNNAVLAQNIRNLLTDLFAFRMMNSTNTNA